MHMRHAILPRRLGVEQHRQEYLRLSKRELNI